jgi:transcriptional regulator with XRE-family HTH domain
VRVSERRRQPGLGFTQAGLPEIMGVAPGRVSQIEHGEVSTVKALASCVAALDGKLGLIADIGYGEGLLGCGLWPGFLPTARTERRYSQLSGCWAARFAGFPWSGSTGCAPARASPLRD